MLKFHTQSIWAKLALTISGGACAILLMTTHSKLSFAVTAVLALFLMAVLAFRTRFLSELFQVTRWPLALLAGVLSVSTVYTAKSTFYSACWNWMNKFYHLLGLPNTDVFIRLTPWVMAVLALPMAFGYFLWFVRFMVSHGKRFWDTSDYTERMFLLGAGILFAGVILLTYYCTQAFYGAHINGAWYNFDLIYSADSGYLVHQDVFRNVGAEQNDLRQPLFGLFAMPFAQVAWLLSKLLYFLPNVYVTALQMIEMLLFLIACVLIARMLELSGYRKALFLALLCVSYPVLIFSLTAEQYLFAVFYLILLLYLRDKGAQGSLSYIAATGCMLTSGIFFPLITWERDVKRFCQKTLMLCGAFFGVMILSGRLTTLLDIPGYISGYGVYAGADVALKEKLMQYVNFMGSVLVAPASQVDFDTYRHVSWQMVAVDGWRPLGILVGLGAVLGVFVGRKKRFCRICGVWIAFSFVLLGLIGWGTIDNGLLLYSLYFGWAFLAMLYELLQWLLGRWKYAHGAALIALILVVGWVNVSALREVLVFATQFYPALR